MKLLTLSGLALKLREARDTDTGALVPGLTADSLHRLGAMLARVSLDGEDARKVFGLPKRGKGQPAKSANFRAVVAYWRHRVEHPTDAAGAAQVVHDRYGIERKTIERLARKQRDAALSVIEQRFERLEGGRPVKGQKGPDTTALRIHLAKKSKGLARPKSRGK